jgi:hypothetical protein
VRERKLDSPAARPLRRCCRAAETTSGNPQSGEGARRAGDCGETSFGTSKLGFMTGVDLDNGQFSSKKGYDDEKAVIWHIIRANGVRNQYRLGGRVAAECGWKLVRTSKSVYRNTQHYLSRYFWKL